MKKTVKILIGECWDVPEYATAGAAGMDLHAANEEPIYLPAGERVLVPTGIKLEIPVGMQAEIRPRSGLVLKHGVTVLNTPGTIDSDYRGSIGVILHNAGKKRHYINKGDRIAQMVFTTYTRVTLKEVDKLTKTQRGSGGFGSTGK